MPSFPCHAPSPPILFPTLPRKSIDTRCIISKTTHIGMKNWKRYVNIFAIIRASLENMLPMSKVRWEYNIEQGRGRASEIWEMNGYGRLSLLFSRHGEHCRPKRHIKCWRKFLYSSKTPCLMEKQRFRSNASTRARRSTASAVGRTVYSTHSETHISTCWHCCAATRIPTTRNWM